MQQTVSPTPSPSASTFAGMLAAFAAPAQKRQMAWNDDDLADDVATLSYERALRAHGRQRPSDPSPLPLPNPEDAESLRIYEVSSRAHPSEAEEPAQSPDAQPAPDSTEALYAVPGENAAHEFPAILDRNLKSASITIRMSRTECAQLRKRSAEAGLTVSAYIRSCTFEAESLRALVKDTLAELRSTSNRAEKAVVSHAQPRSQRRYGWRHWFAWLWPAARIAQRTVQA